MPNKKITDAQSSDAGTTNPQSLSEQLRAENPYAEGKVRHIDLKQRSAILKTLDGEGFETDAFISMIKDAAYKDACDTLAKLESNK
jgi:hypothetical protein